MIVNYIAKQREHHKKETIEEEMRRLLIEADIKIDEKYWNED